MALLLFGTGLAGCTAGRGQDDALVVWSLENQTDRVRATERILDRFTQQTGVAVRLVAVDENQFSQMIMSAAAAGRPPDVIGALPLTATWQLAGNELLDTGASQEIVDRLGASTFSSRALRLTRDGDRQLAVPSDGWAQILVYRKDLFAAAGLGTPDTYDRIRQAARVLNHDGMAGISIATSANDAATGQAFEGLATGNGCELVDGSGRIALDDGRCHSTFRFVEELITSYSPPGAQDLDSTRATYLAGRSAMIMWSSYLLDELGGLRSDAMPSCPQCQADPGFLAANSGVVGAIKGPDSDTAAQYGELTSWTVQVGAKRAEAVRLVEYMMGEQAYPEWLGMAPEGKIPVRRGTVTDPRRFTDAWEKMPAGVDSKRPLGEIYPPQTMRELRDSPDRFRRWGFDHRQGVLMGATLSEMPVGKAVESMLSGTRPDEAAGQAAADVRAIQTSLR
ncbi:ABC transporter substrate-binding protein [Kibdelosporangium persicum]|uniref:ABC transporter substrate-binding protein n=1 Tax=Kibdelosporangium persicum TaxID=2698649 RepID=UPI001C25E827|nr:extracellular solute-binding protein [Kibdelosporangium persicum]